MSTFSLPNKSHSDNKHNSKNTPRNARTSNSSPGPSSYRHLNAKKELDRVKRNSSDQASCRAPADAAVIPPLADIEQSSIADNAAARRPITSLPCAQTFKRQESEDRERLCHIEPSAHEHHETLLDKRDCTPSVNALTPPVSPDDAIAHSLTSSILSEPSLPPPSRRRDVDETRSTSSSTRSRPQDLPLLQIPQIDSPDPTLLETKLEKPAYKEPAYEELWEEFRKRWFLNMSMNYRERSGREKFFVTFAEKPNLWRRVTISVNYRRAPLNSLEDQLNRLESQNDKSFRIFRAIHESLPQIYYFDTVTNLRIETTADDMQLHVHVQEDANEIVQFPSTAMFRHISCPRLCEASLSFDSHLAGFVYKVKSRDRFLIKKEIPGPDAIEEFLYEVNALDALRGSDNVIRMEGLVTDDRGECVKGLLLSYATQGSLLDILWEHSKGKPQIPWQRREKWARQIVHGLSEIHEAGFVQGDFTLSNIVIDHTDTARIIDINRRGCPIGWEPPEFQELLSSGQRLNMAIGVKTDLFQLGMVLWSLAEHTDEPEIERRPLRDPVNAPTYFRDLVRTCLSLRPQDRRGANTLVDRFPENVGADPASFPDESTQNIAGSYLEVTPSLEETELDACPRPSKVYIDPRMAVTLDDCKPNWRSEAPLLKPDAPKPSAGLLAPSANISARRVRDKDVEYLTSANRQSNLTSTSYHLGDHSELSLCSPSRDRSSRPRRPSSATSALLSGAGDDDNYEGYDEYDEDRDIDDDNSDASSIRYAIMKRKQRLGAQRPPSEEAPRSESNTDPRNQPVRFVDIPASTSHDPHAVRPRNPEYGPAPDINDPAQMALYEAWLWEQHHASQARMNQRLQHQQQQQLQQEHAFEPEPESKHLQHVDSGFDETMIEALDCRDDDDDDDDDDVIEESFERILSNSSQSTEKGGSEGMGEKSALASSRTGGEVQVQVQDGLERKGGRLRVR